jgi:dTMP kinase
LILDGAAQDISKHTYAYLFAADREEHMRKVVIPAVEQGVFVVSDRSVISDFAYRPYHGNHVRRRHLKQFWSLSPITFYVDIDDEVALERMTSRGKLNEFEKAHVVGKIDQLKRAYEKVALPKAPAWHLVDNNRTLEDSWRQIENYLGNVYEIYL